VLLTNRCLFDGIDHYVDYFGLHAIENIPGADIMPIYHDK